MPLYRRTTHVTTGPGVNASRGYVDRDAARRRFGGLDLPASLVGMLVGLAMELLLGGLAAAILGTSIDQTAFSLKDAATTEGAIVALVVALVIMAIAWFVGGWAAGRMARYDGALNGAMAAVWALVLAAILAGVGYALGDKYDVFSQIGVPNWFDTGNDTVTGAVIAGILSLATMLLAAGLGGKVGSHYHRVVDEYVGTVRTGGIDTVEGDTTIERA
jgi:hypothetical protein